MNRLPRSYWRLAWVLLTNALVMFLLLTGPFRVHHDQQALQRLLQSPPEPFSYWGQLFSAPWLPLMVLVLLFGIVSEIRRSALSPIFNLGPYLVWLAVALWERARLAGQASPYELYVGKMLLMLPLTILIIVGLIFYAFAFRRKRPERLVSGV